MCAGPIKSRKVENSQSYIIEMIGMNWIIRIWKTLGATSNLENFVRAAHQLFLVFENHFRSKINLENCGIKFWSLLEYQSILVQNKKIQIKIEKSFFFYLIHQKDKKCSFDQFNGDKDRNFLCAKKREKKRIHDSSLVKRIKKKANSSEK